MAKRKPKLPPNPTPWPCTILAVDTSTNSGWSLWADGQFRMSGECDIADEQALRDVCRSATGHNNGKMRECVLVLEKAWGGPRNNVATLVALGRAQQAWLSGWAAHGGKSTRVVKVSPPTWRARVLGGRFASAKRDVVRAAEVFYAQSVTMRMGVGYDEAAAICIGKWASHAGEVGKVLPKRLTRAA